MKGYGISPKKHKILNMDKVLTANKRHCLYSIGVECWFERKLHDKTNQKASLYRQYKERQSPDSMLAGNAAKSRDVGKPSPSTSKGKTAALGHLHEMDELIVGSSVALDTKRRPSPERKKKVPISKEIRDTFPKFNIVYLKSLVGSIFCDSNALTQENTVLLYDLLSALAFFHSNSEQNEQGKQKKGAGPTIEKGVFKWPQAFESMDSYEQSEDDAKLAFTYFFNKITKFSKRKEQSLSQTPYVCLALGQLASSYMKVAIGEVNGDCKMQALQDSNMGNILYFGDFVCIELPTMQEIKMAVNMKKIIWSTFLEIYQQKTQERSNAEDKKLNLAELSVELSV